MFNITDSKVGKFVRVDPLSAVPKYYQLAEILRQQIDNDQWRPHDPLPPERELETLYNVSRTTVREALNYLSNQGYIYREHGRGTFVARSKTQPSLHVWQSFSAEMQARGFVPGQRILSLDYINPPIRVKQQLDLSPEINQVLRLERLRYADDEAIGLHTAYLPLSPEQSITQEELQITGSLYTLLEAKLGLTPIEADVTLEATAADKREANLLQVNEGTPLFLMERTTFSQHRQPMEFVKILYRADRYKYYVHMNRV